MERSKKQTLTEDTVDELDEDVLVGRVGEDGRVLANEFSGSELVLDKRQRQSAKAE